MGTSILDLVRAAVRFRDDDSRAPDGWRSRISTGCDLDDAADTLDTSTQVVLDRAAVEKVLEHHDYAHSVLGWGVSSEADDIRTALKEQS